MGSNKYRTRIPTPLIHNNLVYIPLISKGTGEIWLDRNIGATQAPRSINDTGDAFGDFFFIRADAQVAGVCPPGYRLPIKAEWEAEMATFADNGGYHLGALNTLKITLTGRADTGTGSTGTTNIGTHGYYFSSGDESTNYSGHAMRPSPILRC